MVADMEEKVGYILKIIDEDGDSFARRAEMYYRKRPEILNFVEDTFRNYRALAERYDHISRELQNANRTIATVYPERVQLAMEDEDGESFLGGITGSPEEWSAYCKDLPAAPKSTLPRVLSMTRKNKQPSRMMSKKGLLKFNGIEDVKPFPSSGLSKEEALEEIDELQKQILGLQTEREFVTSSYESGVKRQKLTAYKMSFGIGTIIEDNEARSLMTSTALKSCQETLNRLQGQHEKSNEEVAVEGKKVQKLTTKFDTLVETLTASQEPKHQKLPSEERTPPEPNMDSRKSEQQVGSTQQGRIDVESLREKIKEELQVSSATNVNMSELAEKVDELVEKIISLESAVQSQNSYVNRLKAEANELHEHLHRVEDEKESLIQDSENMNKKIRELEKELQRVLNLNHKVNDHSNHIQTRIAEASCRLDDLAGKLINVLPDEETNTTAATGQEQLQVHKDLSANNSNSTVSGVQMAKDNLKKDGNSEMIPSTSPKEIQAHDAIPAAQSTLAISGVKSTEEKQMKDGNPEQGTSALHSLMITTNFISLTQCTHAGIHQHSRTQVEKDEPVKEDDQPNWKELFLNGLDDRDKLLLDEYITALGNYRDVKNKLNEAEKKRRASQFQYVVQVKVLKNSNALKDAQIQSLQKKLRENHLESPKSSESTVKASLDTRDEPTDVRHRLTLSELLHDSTLKETASQEKSKGYPAGEETTSQEEIKSPSTKDDEEDIIPEVLSVEEPQCFSAIEEKIRTDIDDLLEENIQFWHRFSNAFQLIRKYETSVEDLHTELQDAREKAKQEGNNKPMLSSLSNIEDEITMLSKEGPEGEEPELGTYQAAKFQGEIQNMKQENKKVASQLEAGVELVHKLQDDINKTISKLDEEFGFKKDNSSSRSRIPLRSFLFGVKTKKQKPSIFACSEIDCNTCRNPLNGAKPVPGPTMTIGIEGSAGNLKFDGRMKMGAELQLLLLSKGIAFWITKQRPIVRW
nr:protein NETWORKED 2A [Ipomoea batatas]